jgi:spore germination cell wall hydrolase CwlJ-like protein
MDYDELVVLAKTIYGEARGEYYRLEGGLSAFIAVANVIKNRSAYPTKYGRSITEICRKPYQFSCWNARDPNYIILQNINTEQDALFKLAFQVAEGVWRGEWPDITKGSNHYHVRTMKQYPSWSQGIKPRVCLGNHLFYQL